MSDGVLIPDPTPGERQGRDLSRVYQRYHRELYRYCHSILRHEQDAQDALQSTMERALAALAGERREIALRPWLFRIAHNESVSLLRRRGRTDALPAELDGPALVEDRVAEREALRQLRADLSELPERQRTALVLRELSGLSHAEIGQVLDLPATGVKQAIFDARRGLLASREGRELPCRDVRRALSDGDGRVLRGRGLRAHLRGCSACAEFLRALRTRPRALSELVPPLPAGGALALLAQVLGAGGSAVAGGGAVAAKVLVGVALVGGAGVVVADAPRTHPPAARAAPAPASPAQAPASPAPERASPGRAVAVVAPVRARPAIPRHSAAKPAARTARRKRAAPSKPAAAASKRGRTEAKAQRKAAKAVVKADRTPPKGQVKKVKPVKLKPAKPAKLKPVKSKPAKPGKLKPAKPGKPH